MQAKHNDSVHSVPGQDASEILGDGSTQHNTTIQKDLLAGANSSIVDPMQGDSKFLDVEDSINQGSLINPQGSLIMGSHNDNLATSIEEESYEKVVGSGSGQGAQH